MQEFSVNDAALSEIMVFVAKGETVRLLDNGQQVALVSPTSEPQTSRANGEEEAIDRAPGWWMRLREKYNIDEIGFTQEEIDSMRDRSPGPEPPVFE